MPARQAPCVELGSAPEPPSLPASSPSVSDISGTSSPEPPPRPTALFRALAMPPPPPAQPSGQEELERRLPGFRRIVLPREPTLIELLKQSSGVRTDDEVLSMREARLRVVAERVGLRRLHVLAPRLRTLTLDGSALASLRDLGTGLTRLRELHVCRCGLGSLDGVLGVARLRELYASGNHVRNLEPLAALRRLHTLDLSDNPISESSRIWTLGVCGELRRLRLSGTPAAAAPGYSRRVGAALPMLRYLDDAPLDDSASVEEMEDLFRPAAATSSESEPEDEVDGSAASREPRAGASSPPAAAGEVLQKTVSGEQVDSTEPRRRPASTACAGARPAAPHVPRRPHSTLPVSASAAAAAAAAARLELTGLEALNRLLDADSRCSGSRLTSGALACGNLAQALRRPSSASATSAATTAATSAPTTSSTTSAPTTSATTSAATTSAKASASTERSLTTDVELVCAASRELAVEIPPCPSAEMWAKFRQLTGIELDLDFDERPKEQDPSTVLSRLEEIERDTRDRMRREDRKNAAGQNTGDESNAYSNRAYTERINMLTSDISAGDYITEDSEMEQNAEKVRDMLWEKFINDELP